MITMSAELYSRGCQPSRPPLSAHKTPTTVFVIDDDAFVCRMLERLIGEAGFEVETFDSAEAFLCLPRPAVPSCLLLDVTLPGTSGIEVQRQVGASADLPVIFITGHPDVRVTVQAMKAGAVDVLAKPVNPELLLSAVHAAIELSREALQRDAAMREVRGYYATLTPREREVMALVVSGLLNKQVAFELGISEITVKAHRGQVMRKMKADSLPHLVRMAARLDVARTRSVAEPV
jgi:FixJ family two-component response regulator